MTVSVQIDDKKNKIYAPIKGKWLIKTPEEEVRQTYIERLVKHYGFSHDQMGQEISVSNSSRGQGRARADIVVWKSKADKEKLNSPVIVVECKAENITIREEDCFQGLNYASWVNADFFVTTNLKETRIFKVLKGKIPDRLEEIIDIPDAKSINDEKKIKELLTKTKAFTRDEFSKLLFTCHNIIRNNDKLSPEAAFDEISKILFIKIRYERSNQEAQIFSKKQFLIDKAAHDRHRSKDSRPFYQQLFESTKDDFKDDDLFAENETIRIRENSFEAIVEKLQKYNLSTTSDDVKGIAFEQFLGKTFRGELGQFFTPRTIVDFMVEVLDPQEGEVICDPCCGSGGFLIKAFEYVRTKIEAEIQKQKQQIKEEYYTENFDKLSEKKQTKIDEKVNQLFQNLNQELDINNPKSRIRELSYDCIFGTDIHSRTIRTAKANMIMHGSGYSGLHCNDGLLNVNGIFENHFDIILANPPFGGQISTPTLDLYRIGKISNRIDVLFIERCLNLLKPGGRMGIVLHENILDNSKFQKVRNFVESRAKILLITSIPRDVFVPLGTRTKASLLFFRKFTEEETEQWHRINSKAKLQIGEKYTSEINLIESQIKETTVTTEKKKLKKSLKALEVKIKEEIKAQIKKDFDYQIPIAEVKKAGISTTGAVIENELKPLAQKFTKHRKKHQLWQQKSDATQYITADDGTLMRQKQAAEPEVFYE